MRDNFFGLYIDRPALIYHYNPPQSHLLLYKYVTMTNPSNSYIWRINHLVYNNTNSHSKVVSLANYTVRAERGGLAAEYTGLAEIPQGDLAQSFTPFEALEETQVMAWVMSTFSVESLQTIIATVDQDLDSKLTASYMLAGSLPWAPVDGAQDIPVVMPSLPTLGNPDPIPVPVDPNPGMDLPNPGSIPVQPPV